MTDITDDTSGQEENPQIQELKKRLFKAEAERQTVIEAYDALKAERYPTPNKLKSYDELCLEADGDIAIEWANDDALFSMSVHPDGQSCWAFSNKTTASSGSGRFDLPADVFAVLRSQLSRQEAHQECDDTWRQHVRKLTQWRHCMSYNRSYFGEPSGLLKSVTSELDRLASKSKPSNEWMTHTSLLNAWLNAKVDISGQGGALRTRLDWCAEKLQSTIQCGQKELGGSYTAELLGVLDGIKTCMVLLNFADEQSKKEAK